MVAITAHEAHHGCGQQAIQLGAALMRAHHVSGQGVGAFQLGLLQTALSEREKPTWMPDWDSCRQKNLLPRT
jgi:hypothetical protein